MKKIISICCLLATIFFAGCTESDMNSIREDLNTLTGKVETLTSDVTLINRQIVALQTLVSAINSYDYVTSIEPISENGETVGYTINFAKSSAVTIYNGENASAPVISVAKDSDGLYYWTVQVGSDAATWLLDLNGEKVATTGADGASGAAGSDGATPVISVDELDGVLYWKVDGEWLYYNGEMVPTTGSNGVDGTDGEDGKDGEDGSDGSAGADGAAGGNLDASTVTYTDNGATVTINFGSSSFTFDKATGSLSFLKTEDVTINDTFNTIEVVMPTTLAEADFAALQAEVVSSNGESGAEVVTKSESQLGKWGVEISTPTYSSGKWSNPIITISKPTDLNTSTIKAQLTVTLVEKDGTTSSSSVAFTYLNDDSAALVASADDIANIENKDAVESLVIDGSATDIEDILTAVAQYLPNLTYLNLSDCSDVTVPEGCFRNNTILKTVILPAGSTIGGGAFWGCTALETVTISGDNTTTIAVTRSTTTATGTIGDGAFAGCTALTSITCEGITSIGINAFEGCTALESFTANSVTTLANFIFTGCTALKSVEMTSVIYLSIDLFYNCTSLTTVNLPNVKYIDSYSFHNCSSLESITMGNVRTVGAYVFEGCDKLTSVTLANATNENVLRYIYPDAFDDTEKIDLTLGEANRDLVSFGNYLTTTEGEYKYKFKFKSITIGDDSDVNPNSANLSDYSATAYPTDNTWIVNTAADQSYADFVGLKAALEAAAAADATRKITLQFPSLETLTASGDSPFKGITSIEEIQFTVMTDTYYAKSLITEIGEPISLVMDGVTSVGGSAFRGCDALTSVTMNSVTSVDGSAFEDCTALTSVTMNSVTSVGDSAFRGCYKLTSVTMNRVTSVGNYAFYNCDALTSVTMNSVTSVEGNAFEDCDALTSVTMNSVTSVGNSAFRGCYELTSVTMNSVTSVGQNAFEYCTALTSVTMNSVTSVGNYAFLNCTALTSVTMNSVTSVGSYAFRDCTALTSVTMNSVTSVGDYAFYSCTALTSVTMNSVTSVGDYAFNGCNELEKINFPKVTEIGNNAFSWCNTLVTASLATEANTKLNSLGTNIFYDGNGGENNLNIALTLG
ncbi:MAG: leucine-rich repeat protein, partial [Rikenellaceae bacterium]